MLEHKFADVNGIRLHYCTSGQGKLILFLHGFPEFWYAWKNQLTEFGAHYQAVALDLRGYNLSDKPAEVEQYRVKYVVQDVLALAAHLQQDRFILVGHDWAARPRGPVRPPARIVLNVWSSSTRRTPRSLRASWRRIPRSKRRANI